MSSPNIDPQDKADFFYSSGPACGNCGAQRVGLTWMEKGDWMACDPCAEEQERLDLEARALAVVASECDERAGIVDDARTSRELLNRLRAHSAECAICGSARKTVESDRRAEVPDTKAVA